jgi:hypothetical protein
MKKAIKSIRKQIVFVSKSDVSDLLAKLQNVQESDFEINKEKHIGKISIL